MKKCLLLHGPNLNLLGTREPGLYGKLTLSDINQTLFKIGEDLNMEVESRQSNIEGELVDWIQQSNADGIIINAGAYTHTSIALRDALIAVRTPFIEVHMTNPKSRESFRHKSLLADKAVGSVAGFGWKSYKFALEGLAEVLREGKYASTN